MITTEEEIKRLNDELLLVRKCVGWSAEELGEQIGVTRQTINNLEAKRCKLSKTQYIAIRSVLDDEMEAKPDETEMLKVVLDAFVDHPENYDEAKKEEIRKKVSMLSSAINSDNSNRKEVSKECMAILLGLGILLMPITTLFVVGSWRKKK